MPALCKKEEKRARIVYNLMRFSFSFDLNKIRKKCILMVVKKKTVLSRELLHMEFSSERD